MVERLRFDKDIAEEKAELAKKEKRLAEVKAHEAKQKVKSYEKIISPEDVFLQKS